MEFQMLTFNQACSALLTDPCNIFMHRINSLTSPRSKPISEYTKELRHITFLSAPPFLKSKLLEGLLSQIQYKIHCLNTPKLKSQLSVKLQEELLWKQIQRMERCIITKRAEKEQMENNICMYHQELANMEEIWQLKKQIRDRLLEQLQTHEGKKEISERETLVSLDDTGGGEVAHSMVGGMSMQSQNSQGCS